MRVQQFQSNMSNTDALDLIIEKLDKLDVVDDLVNLMKIVQEKIDNLAKKVATLEVKNSLLGRNVHALRSSTKRHNIILYNVEESPTESNDDLKRKVTEIVTETTKVQLQDSDICRVRRIGNELTAGTTRPVRIEFDSLTKKMSVASNFSEFKSTKFNASLDYTTDVLKKRKMLTPKMHEARRKGSHAILVGAYLYINGKRLITAETPTSYQLDVETPSTSEESDPTPKLKRERSKKSKTKFR